MPVQRASLCRLQTGSHQCINEKIALGVIFSEDVVRPGDGGPLLCQETAAAAAGSGEEVVAGILKALK